MAFIILLTASMLFMLPYCIGGICYVLVKTILYKKSKLEAYKENKISIFVAVFSTIVPLTGLIFLLIFWKKFFGTDDFDSISILFNFGQICWLGLILLAAQETANQYKNHTKIILYLSRIFIIATILVTWVNSVAIFLSAY